MLRENCPAELQQHKMRNFKASTGRVGEDSPAETAKLPNLQLNVVGGPPHMVHLTVSLSMAQSVLLSLLQGEGREKKVRARQLHPHLPILEFLNGLD